jgi:phosphoglycolate phosphatase
MTEEESLEACGVYREAFANRELDEVRLFNGIEKVLDRLHEGGVPLAIASSRSRPSLWRLIEHLGLAGRFTVVAGREDARREKPYPDMLLGVANRLGIDAGNLLMVGDTTYDIRMGHNAGAATCAVTYGNHSREELAAAYPTFMVDSPRELSGAPAFAR